MDWTENFGRKPVGRKLGARSDVLSYYECSLSTPEKTSPQVCFFLLCSPIFAYPINRSSIYTDNHRERGKVLE